MSIRNAFRKLTDDEKDTIEDALTYRSKLPLEHRKKLEIPAIARNNARAATVWIINEYRQDSPSKLILYPAAIIFILFFPVVHNLL